MSLPAVLGYLASLPRPGWTWPAESAPDPREEHDDPHGGHAPEIAEPASDPRPSRV